MKWNILIPKTTGSEQRKLVEKLVEKWRESGLLDRLDRLRSPALPSREYSFLCSIIAESQERQQVAYNTAYQTLFDNFNPQIRSRNGN